MKNSTDSLVKKEELKIYREEELVWLVSLLFTDKFANKHDERDFVFDSKKNDAYFAEILSWVNANQGAKNLLNKIKSELIYTDSEKKSENENTQKINTLDFLRWAEKNRTPIPQNIVDSVKWLFQMEFMRKQSEQEEKFNFPDLPAEEFELLQKEPLWQVCKAVLYVNGTKSEKSGEKIISHIKYNKDMDKLCLYITQAHKAKKLKLIADGIVFDLEISSTKPDYNLIEERLVEPKQFIEWAKTLPLKFPILEIKSSVIQSAIAEELKANFREWSLKPSWTVFEAACLSFGLSPHKVRYESLKAENNSDRYELTSAQKFKTGMYGEAKYQKVDIEEFTTRFEIMLRQKWGNNFALTPSAYKPDHKLPALMIIDWFKDKEIDFPNELAKLVRKNAPKEVVKKADIQQPTVNKSAVVKTNEGARAKTITSLNKLVIAMAIEKYGYKPEHIKKTSTTNIKNAVERMGIKIDDQAILARLKEAYEEFQDEIDEYLKPKSQ